MFFLLLLGIMLCCPAYYVKVQAIKEKLNQKAQQAVKAIYGRRRKIKRLSGGKDKFEALKIFV
jgi:hypothetical protein